MARVPIAVALLVGAASSAAAQSSPVSELWREWAVLAADWRAEQTVYDLDRARNRALREGAGQASPEAPAAEASP